MERFKEPFEPAEGREAGAALLHLRDWEDEHGLTAGFSTRGGGLSMAPRSSLNVALHVGDDAEAVIANRRRAAEALGWDFASFTCAEQVHGSRVHVVTAEDRGRGRSDRETAIPDADALITAESGILLAMYFADCVPLYFYDPATGAMGLAHAGWKGTVADIAGETIRRMNETFGARPETVKAAIGPSIGGCCYEVDEAVLKHVRPAAERLDEAGIAGESPFGDVDENGRARLDLKELNRRLMIKAGILPTRIELTTWCTSCRTDLFFSHRRERGATGRMMSWLGKAKE